MIRLICYHCGAVPGLWHYILVSYTCGLCTLTAEATFLWRDQGVHERPGGTRRVRCLTRAAALDVLCGNVSLCLSLALVLAPSVLQPGQVRGCLPIHSCGSLWWRALPYLYEYSHSHLVTWPRADLGVICTSRPAMPSGASVSHLGLHMIY